MRQRRSSSIRFASALVAGAASLVSAPASAEPLLGLLNLGSTGSALTTFDSTAPGTTSAPVAVTGLAGDSRLVGIDLRPTTGIVYALGNAGGLYTINPLTAVATAIGSVAASFANGVGFDFNPVPDLAGLASLRIVTSDANNFRINVNTTPSTTNVDGNLNGATTAIAASAYTNNDRDAATGTALFGIGAAPAGSAGLGLYQQNPANDGTLTFIGALGIAGAAFGVPIGFDISAGGTAFASFAANGVTGLYSINIGSGAASLLGAFPAFGNYLLNDITALTVPMAPVPEPETYALMLAGLAGLAAVARRRRRARATAPAA